MTITKPRARGRSATKILGVVTTYHGSEHPYLRGHKVRVIAVLKNAARSDYDPDADNGYLKDDADITCWGGVSADDRIEVQPWLDKEGRFSFVSSDPRAIDLAAFAHLAR